MDPWDTPQLIRALSEKIFFYKYTKNSSRQTTFKPFRKIIRKAHTFHFFYQYIMIYSVESLL